MRELLLHDAATESFVGIGVGTALFTLCMGILAGVDAYRITDHNEVATMLTTIPGFVIGAVIEEVLFWGNDFPDFTSLGI